MFEAEARVALAEEPDAAAAKSVLEVRTTNRVCVLLPRTRLRGRLVPSLPCPSYQACHAQVLAQVLAALETRFLSVLPFCVFFFSSCFVLREDRTLPSRSCRPFSATSVCV